ncbi:MAG: RpiB/LacA/LacB family sugar-phosphate isomerase [Sphaerochaetaceae bacterium]|nr:RpiB/LacA/LacB family sugar-phosphate isomerase [Sphaerochaetaceae bacterium]
MNIVIANDHGAVELTARIIKHLEDAGHTVKYLGIDHEESVDYPDQAEKACSEFKKGGYDFGIVNCGTGIGISLSANKIKGIRCALVQDIYSAEKAKQHNNANFIAFGGRVEYKDDPLDILDAYINAKFEGDRHQRRIDKMMALETK